IAICSAVARTSYWPIAESAVCGTSRSVGNRLVAAVIGTWNEWLKPYASACAWSASAPTCTPRYAKAVLHDTCSACSSVVRPLWVGHPPPLSLWMTALVPGGLYPAGPGTVESACMPDISAADSVTSLNVDPGGYTCARLRFSIGFCGSAMLCAQARCAVAA